MRILIIHQRLPFPADNGGKLRAAHVARYLASHHSVALVCFGSEDCDSQFPETKLFTEVKLVPLPKPASAIMRVCSGLPSEVVDLSSAEMSRTISALVELHSPEVILTSEPALSPYLERYPDRVRVLDYLMVSTLSLARLGAIARGWKKLVWRLRWHRSAAYHRRIAPLYDLCLVNSQEDQDELLVNCPGWRQLEFFPNGLHLVEYPLGLARPEPMTLVYPGSVTYVPNRDAVEFMITRILPLVRAELPDVRFVVTGAVPEDGSAPQAPGVIYTGRVPDVRPAIAGANVCVVPLRSGAGGTRFKVLEAMALGTPVVSTTIGAEGVAWSDGVNILIADTPESFAAKTIELLKSPEVRSSISAAGRRLIEERYDWNILGARISNMLARLVEEKKRLASSSPQRQFIDTP